MRRLRDEAQQRGSTRPKAHTDGPVPGRNRLYADMLKLFQRDLANVEAGIYPLPADHRAGAGVSSEGGSRRIVRQPQAGRLLSVGRSEYRLPNNW